MAIDWNVCTSWYYKLYFWKWWTFITILYFILPLCAKLQQNMLVVCAFTVTESFRQDLGSKMSFLSVKRKWMIAKTSSYVVIHQQLIVVWPKVVFMYLRLLKPPHKTSSVKSSGDLLKQWKPCEREFVIQFLMINTFMLVLDSVGGHTRIMVFWSS